MANKQFKVPINLVNLASDPGTASEGDIYYNTTSDVVRVYANGAWASVGSGGGSASDSFKTIAVTGQDSVVADSSTDTLNLVAGTNVSIATNATTDSITINSTGAYTSVDSITYPDYITFDTTPETIPTAAGSLFWDSGDGLPKAILNANVELGIGQEQVAIVKNATGSTIAKGKVVYINGAAGQRPTIALSDADTEATSSKTLGITAESISNGAEGFVTTFGVLRGVNTNGLTEGAAVWLSSTAGYYTTTVPAEPAHSVFLGYVVKAHATAGEIFVNIQNGYELTELHGVVIDGTPADNEVLAYDTTSGLWINQTAVEAGLIDTSATAQTKSGNLTLTGTNSIYDTREYLYAVNDEGETVSALSAVVFNGVSSGVPKFKRADADQIGQSGVVGLTTASIASGATGTIITRGIIDGVNTASYADGQILYISTGGLITGTRPTGTTSRIHKIAKVIIADELAGKIYVLGTIEEDIPNLENLKIWIGNSSDAPTETTLNTTIVPEGTNLYYTDERAQDAVGNSVGSGLSYNDSTGAISNTGVLSIIGTANEIDILGTNTEIQIGIPNSPIFVTPNIGVATATSINGTTIPSSKTLVVTTDIGTSVQAYDADLSSIAALTGTSGILTTNGSGTWSVDTNTYSTTAHNHSVNSLSNVVITGTPSDGQAIVWDTTTSKWVNETVTQDLSSYAPLASPTFTGTVTIPAGASISGYLTTDSAATNYQPLDADLTAIAALSADGVLKKTSGTWGMDATAYAPLSGATFTGNIAVNNGTSTEITTTGTTAKLFHSNATTIEIGHAATTISIGDIAHTGTTTINNNLAVYGSITFSQGASSLSATTIQIDDTMISLADANTADILDIGFFAGYRQSSTDYHTGLVRDASDSGKWKLFAGVTAQPTDTVDFTSATYGTLKIGALEVTDGSTTRINLGLAVGTDVQAYNSTLAAVAGGTYTGDDSITTVGTISSGTWNGTTIGYAYGGTGLTTLGTAGQVLKVNSGATGLEWGTASGGSSFTNSSELAGLLSDETGSGYAVFSESPTFTGTVSVDETKIKTTSTALTSTAATAETIATIPIPSGKEIVSAECLVLLSSTNDGTYYTSKCLIFGGTVAGVSTELITEYAIMGDMLATLSADKVGTNLELKVTVAAYTGVTAKVISIALSADNGAT